MIKISKELLSEVLENEIVRFEIVSTKRITQIRIWYKDTELHLYESWDIYHLAHKCKEWAFYAYKISVSSFKSGSFYLKEFNQIKDNSEYWVELDNASIDCEININDSGIFKSYSEPEAIFKACQWILDNKETK